MSQRPRHPTLDELRATVQKQRHREIGNWLARRVARPSAVYGTWVAVRLGLSANQVTLPALAASLAGALAIGTGLARLRAGTWPCSSGLLARSRGRSGGSLAGNGLLGWGLP